MKGLYVLSVTGMEDFRNQTTYLDFMQAGVTDSDLLMVCPITYIRNTLHVEDHFMLPL